MPMQSWVKDNDHEMTVRTSRTDGLALLDHIMSRFMASSTSK